MALSHSHKRRKVNLGIHLQPCYLLSFHYNTTTTILYVTNAFTRVPSLTFYTQWPYSYKQLVVTMAYIWSSPTKSLNHEQEDINSYKYFIISLHASCQLKCPIAECLVFALHWFDQRMLWMFQVGLANTWQGIPISFKSKRLAQRRHGWM